jgi:predicted MPP superfamily phosphohydrolase
VDLRGLLGLDDPIGLFICLAGVLAQLWLVRKTRTFFVLNVLFCTVLVVTFFALAEYWFPSYRRLFSLSASDWTVALIQIWCLCMIFASLVVAVRDRVPDHDQSRRKFLKMGTLAVCAIPPAVTSFGIITRKNFSVKEVEVKLPSLPRDLDNLRIVQLSDIHLSDFYSPKDLVHVIDAANELRGDLAVVTGDLVTIHSDPLEICLNELSRLKNTSGIWGCLGNHESFAGVENEAARLGAELGVNFLRWQARNLKFGNANLNLVGVDYQRTRLPYLVEGEELVDTNSFNVLLSHNPDVFPVAVSKGFDLVLAGHTHGGQINVEIFDKNLNIARFVTPYTKGLYRSSNSAIYVNSGIGTIGMPIRLGAPPEITLLKLCAS